MIMKYGKTLVEMLYTIHHYTLLYITILLKGFLGRNRYTTLASFGPLGFPDASCIQRPTGFWAMIFIEAKRWLWAVGKTCHLPSDQISQPLRDVWRLCRTLRGKEIQIEGEHLGILHLHRNQRTGDYKIFKACRYLDLKESSWNLFHTSGQVRFSRVSNSVNAAGHSKSNPETLVNEVITSANDAERHSTVVSLGRIEPAWY